MSLLFCKPLSHFAEDGTALRGLGKLGMQISSSKVYFLPDTCIIFKNYLLVSLAERLRFHTTSILYDRSAKTASFSF